MHETARPRPFRALFSALAAGTLALVVWNSVLGVVVDRNPGYRESVEMGRTLNPGTVVQSEEGFARTQVDSLGFRNPEIGPKTPGSRRVVCLGDSFTIGVQVADGDTFVAGLRQRLGDGYEVVNAARDGISPATHLAVADFYRRGLSPDVVVFELSPNSLKSVMLDPNAEFYAVPDGEGYRIVRNAKVPGDNAILRRIPRLNTPAVRRLIAAPAVRVAAHNVSVMLAPASDQRERDKNTRAVPALYRWAVRQLHERFPNLVLLYIGQPDYFSPVPPDGAAAILADEAKALGVPFLDATPLLDDHWRRTGELGNGFSNSVPGEGHINVVGHRLIAEALTPLVQGMR